MPWIRLRRSLIFLSFAQRKAGPILATRCLDSFGTLALTSRRTGGSFRVVPTHRRSSHIVKPRRRIRSARPAEQRQTAVGGLDAINLEHDAAAPIAGTRAAQAAAAATRPPAPLALELVRPAAGERIGRIGTGWGNVPRAVERRPAPAAPVVEVSGVSGGLAPI